MIEIETIFDGKSKPSLSSEIWIIRHKYTDDTVFEYRTYQGNKRKALFNLHKHAESVLNRYIKNPEDYYILRV
jgi:hypothetical protein